MARGLARGAAAVVIGFLAGSLLFGAVHLVSAWSRADGSATGGDIAPGAVRGPRGADRRPHLARGQKLLAEERAGEAWLELTKAARLAPDDPRPHQGLGEVYRRFTYDRLSERELRRALELEPSHRPSRLALAKVLLKLGKNEEAVRLLEALRRETPEDPMVWAELSRNEMRLGHPERAVPLLEKYNELQGVQGWGLANLARALEEAGRAREAERAYLQAVRADPFFSLAWLWLGQYLTGAGRTRDAKSALARFRELASLGRREHALQKALQRRENDLDALRELTLVRLRLGRPRKAKVPLERALRLAPADERLAALRREIEARLAKESAGGK